MKIHSALSLILLTLSTIFALDGRVIDINSSPIANAKLKLSNSDTIILTDSNGRFSIVNATSINTPTLSTNNRVTASYRDNIFTISAESKRRVSFVITNLRGQLISNHQIVLLAGQNTVPINRLSSGLYILWIKGDGVSITQRFVGGTDFSTSNARATHITIIPSTRAQQQLSFSKIGYVDTSITIDESSASLGDIVLRFSFDREVFNKINEHRVSINLSPLAWSDRIYEMSLVHSKNMASGALPLGHDGFSERADTLQSELKAQGVAENVAYGYNTVQKVVDGWLSSDGHKKNIEGAYNTSALAVAYKNDGTPYYTQIFANIP